MLLNEWVDHRKGCATCHPKLPLYRSFGWQIWEIWGIWELRVITLSRTEFINTLYFSKRWILLFGSLFKKRRAKIIIIDSQKLKVFCQCWNFHKRNNQAPKIKEFMKPYIWTELTKNYHILFQTLPIIDSFTEITIHSM